MDAAMECLRPPRALFQADAAAVRLFDFTGAGGIVRAAAVTAVHALAAYLLLIPAPTSHDREEMMLVDFVAPTSELRPASSRPLPPPQQHVAPAPSAPVPRESLPSAPAPVAASGAAAPTAVASAAAMSSSSAAVGESAAPATEARYDADYLHNPKPPYPTTSRRRGEEGRVVLKVLVRADGSAGDVMVQRSSGYGLLDDSARSTVARWRFAAARRGREAVESWVLVPLVFSLEEQG